MAPIIGCCVELTGRHGQCFHLLVPPPPGVPPAHVLACSLSAWYHIAVSGVAQSDAVVQLERRDIRAAARPEGSEGSKISDAEVEAATARNKETVMGHGPLRTALINALADGCRSTSGHLIVKGVIDIMSLYILEPGLKSVNPTHYDLLLESLGKLKSTLFALFFHLP